MSYKDEKQQFDSGGLGSSIMTVNWVTATTLTTFALWRVLRFALFRRSNTGWHNVLFEYIILVLPLILVVTVLASHAALFNITLASIVAILYPQKKPDPRRTLLNRPPPSPTLVYSPPGTPARVGTPVSHSSPVHRFPLSPRTESNSNSLSPSFDVSFSDKLEPHTKHDASPASFNTIQLHVSPRVAFRRPYVTIYRAHMMLVTIICILAVDFQVFPRYLTKTETWGTSLMDLGVGSFVFSLGMVSALPHLRNTPNLCFMTSIKSSCRGSGILVILGFIRLVMVKSIDYPEHITEYGVHWNFYITLACLFVFSAALRPFHSYISYHWIGILITSIHQILLSRFGLESWTLNASRLSIFSANKEGIASLLGYLAIYVLGVDTGMYALPPDPYFAYNTKYQNKKVKANPGKTGGVLAGWSLIWWTLVATSRHITPISRQLANASYVFWIVATNVTMLLCYLLISEAKLDGHGTFGQIPVVLDAINRNSLAIFLLANLLTGFVNNVIQTMHTPTSTAILILVIYSTVIVTVSWAFRHMRLKL